MERLQQVIGELNRRLYNPVGLNILWPRRVAFMFVSSLYPVVFPNPHILFPTQLEIEYYVRNFLISSFFAC